MSPTALTIAKRSFNADTENIRGIGFLGIQTVKHYYQIGRVQGRRARLQREAQARLQEVRRLKPPCPWSPAPWNP